MANFTKITPPTPPVFVKKTQAADRFQPTTEAKAAFAPVTHLKDFFQASAPPPRDAFSPLALTTDGAFQVVRLSKDGFTPISPDLDARRFISFNEARDLFGKVTEPHDFMHGITLPHDSFSHPTVEELGFPLILEATLV